MLKYDLDLELSSCENILISIRLKIRNKIKEKGFMKI